MGDAGEEEHDAGENQFAHDWFGIVLAFYPALCGNKYKNRANSPSAGRIWAV